MDVKTQKMFTDIIVNANKRAVSPYSTTAKKDMNLMLRHG